MNDADELRSLIAANALAANDAVSSPTPEVLQRWADTFATDGTFSLEGTEIRGRAALFAFHTRVMTRGTPLPMHFVGASEIDIAESSATGRADFLLVDRDGRSSVGRYEDRYVREGGRWRIAHRRASVAGGASRDVVAIAASSR